METSIVSSGIEVVAKGLEVFGVAVITIAFVHALGRSVIHFRQRREDWYERLKIYIGKALQLALEFLVAADVIRTVIIAPTRENIVSLGLLILVRTGLSWSILVEIEGCWPWEVAEKKDRHG